MTRTVLRTCCVLDLIAIACAWSVGLLGWELALALAGPLYWAAWIVE